MKYVLMVTTNQGEEAACCEEDKGKGHVFTLDEVRELKRSLSEGFPRRVYRIYLLQEME